jgi:hypothetical protein
MSRLPCPPLPTTIDTLQWLLSRETENTIAE